MFISKKHLNLNLGIDADIAAHLVDRKVPEHNAYWKGKYLYVASGMGYLFIPAFLDLELRCGVQKELLLDEEYMRVIENILHSAALYETEQRSFQDHIQDCYNAVQGKIKNKTLYQDITAYFKNENLKPYKNLGTFSKPLNRADSFLFSLLLFDISETTTNCILEQWYALIACLLLMDDIVDLKEDLQNNHENSINDFGPGNIGVEKAIQFLREKFQVLKSMNTKLGQFLEQSLENKLKTPYLQLILNPE